MKWPLNLLSQQCESPDEARKRRLCRKMLELPPEVQYKHVWPGFITLSGLSTLLVGLVDWRLDAPMTITWRFGTIVALVTLAAVCARIHQHYRHVAAGALVLSALLALLAMTVHHQGYLDQVDVLGSLDRSALNDSNSNR